MSMIPLDSYMERIRMSLFMSIQDINASLSQKLHYISVTKIRCEPKTVDASDWVLDVDVK